MSPSTATCALEAVAVNLTIDGVQILTDVTLGVDAGEILAVIGPNGAGKTTLVNILSGQMQPTSGSVLLHGLDFTGKKPHHLAVAGLGRTFQTSNLLLGCTVAENVRLAATAGRHGVLRALRPLRAADRDELAATERLEQVGLLHLRDRKAESLSHGDRRKLELAMVLAQQASVILLDEPMAGVNAEDVPDLVTLIRQVHQDEGVTVLMVEHHLHVVLDLADRIAVLHHGELLALDHPDAIMANETVQTAYLGAPL